MYNFFTDFHHASLLNSLIMLFEGRLGGNLYRPIGMEWAEQGFWKIYDHPATQLQYLGINGATPDGTRPLNEVVGKDALEPPRRGKYLCQDIDSGQTNKAITLDAFMEMKVDIVIASIPQHIEPFKRLCELHPNKPKLIYQVGNAWEYSGDVKNVMASAKISVPQGVNYIEYHQEFDTAIFNPFDSRYGDAEVLKKPEGNTIRSFVNCFSLDGMFAEDWRLFQEVEQILHDWEFECLGGQCRDGAAHGSKEVASKMSKSKFIWHTKRGGDGYGHVLFNSAAVGRPLITKKSYYIGKLGEKLMIDMETCINIDNLSPGQIADKINWFSEPDIYRQMCANVYTNFKKYVDFDQEEQKLRKFLSNLQ